MLDTVKTAETPEGVELKLTCAGFYIRSIAWLIDALIQGFIIILFAFILPRLGDFGMGLLFIVMFFLHWLYPVFFEVFSKGQTPGKKIMKIQVLLLDGTMVTPGASLLRNLLRTVDFLPFFYTLGVVSMLLSRDFRRLGDLVANTIVVYKQAIKDKTSLKQKHLQEKLEGGIRSYAPDIPLSGKEQQTLISYAERQHHFSPERSEELALLARPLLDDLSSDSKYPASERLLRIADYLMGRR